MTKPMIYPTPRSTVSELLAAGYRQNDVVTLINYGGNDFRGRLAGSRRRGHGVLPLDHPFAAGGTELLIDFTGLDGPVPGKARVYLRKISAIKDAGDL